MLSRGRPMATMEQSRLKEQHWQAMGRPEERVVTMDALQYAAQVRRRFDWTVFS
jgi:hypothetical protein